MAEVPAALESVSLNGDAKSYRDIPHRSMNEPLRAHTHFAVKISETAVDFIQKLASAQEQHAKNLNSVAATFRKRTMESLRKDPLCNSGTCFGSWEALLSNTEREAKSCSELAQNMLQSVSKQLGEVNARKKHMMKKWFSFRQETMARVDRTEDSVQRSFKDYQDVWSRYAETVDKGKDSVKDSVILHTYNSHNEYILQLEAFNSLHDEFYGKQVFDMLDELQAIHEDLINGFRNCMQKQIQLSKEKNNSSLTNLDALMDTVSAVNAPADISHFVNGQFNAVKVFPPPKADFRAPDLPVPKIPDSPPLDLPSLQPRLQLVDMTQAPLMHASEEIRKTVGEMTLALEQLHKEYQSVKTLLDSYRENPALGDPNSLIEELLEMRNKIRVKEGELVMRRGKLSLFTAISTAAIAGTGVVHRQSMIMEDSASMMNVCGVPCKSSDLLVIGRDHDWLESEKKLMVFCRYCDGVIQPPISKGLKCRTCKVNVHHKCQKFIPYCSGQAPVKQAKSGQKFMPKVHKRISVLLTRKHTSSPTSQSQSSLNASSPSASSFDEDEDESLGGLYEVPPLPPPKPGSLDRNKKLSPASDVPQPPPRGESLEYGALENVMSHYSFEETVEVASSYNFCVALYDYAKVNPNDIELKAGEVVELLSTASSDWWKGSVGERKGYFPATYVQLVSRGEEVMKAMYDFSPKNSGEMTLEEDQIVVMIRNEGDGWMFGRSGDQEGLFPENYVGSIRRV